ncbi:MAG: 23S rRNA pseudouridine(1911/1915/1917) synthase RluD [Pseudomonadota bacterium]|nr:23S rRNA pseudouridine(1911/1915/1917) synthase RluD [Pseudomonadota bacterium]
MAEKPLYKSIPDSLSGQRLDQALARMFPEYSRSRLKTWILDGQVRVDNREMRPRDPVMGGDQVMLNPVPEACITSEPESMSLNIALEDEDLLVINKPAGLVVHPGAGNPTGTLMNGLLHHAPALRGLPRAGIIHRLDKDTTGLLLVGKTLEAHTALVRALAEREISRQYLAVCNGVLTGGGTIDEPIARHPVNRLKMCVREDGKPAVTHYRVIDRFRAHTYVRVDLETGRTHQIRVHFTYRRHPLLGDPVYGGRMQLPAGESEALVSAIRGFRRQALHASRLEFRHPRNGKLIELDCDLPEDMQHLFETLVLDSGS